VAKGFSLSRGLQLTKKDCKRPFRVCVSVYSQKDFVRQGLLHLAFDLFGGIGRVSNGSIIAAQWRRSSLISFFFIFTKLKSAMFPLCINMSLPNCHGWPINIAILS